jgi:hypothetical protein
LSQIEEEGEKKHAETALRDGIVLEFIDVLV